MSSNHNVFGDFANNPFVSAEPIARKPAVILDGVEIEARTALEVEICWGDQVLHVAHLSPARDVFVGDDAEGPVDYKLPVARVQVVRAASDSIVALGDAGDVTLVRGQRNERRLGDFTVRCAVVAAGKPSPRGSSSRRKIVGYWAASAALHLAIVAGLVLSPGASLDDDGAALDKSTEAYLMQMNKAAATPESKEEEAKSDANSESTNGSSGAAHAGASGQMGNPSKQMTGGHYAIQGSPETAEQKLAKTHALIESNRYGAIGALASVFGATSKSMVVFDGGEESIGRDPANAWGNLTGDHPGDSFGYNGMGPLGTGPGGGGLLDGAGLNRVGGFGHGCVGMNCGDGGEWGGGPSGKGLKRPTQTVKMIETGVDMAGSLPPDTIKRVIRANFPRFRQCYETGLKQDPGLKGTISTRFIIDVTGAIESASLSGGSMSNSTVSSCVLGVYKTLSFPAPESGKVMVTYPIDFQND